MKIQGALQNIIVDALNGTLPINNTYRMYKHLNSLVIENLHLNEAAYKLAENNPELFEIKKESYRTLILTKKG